MRQGIGKIILSLLLGFIFFVPQLSVEADEAGQMGKNFGVSIEDYPNNQMESVGESGFFYLKVKPADKQDVTIKVTNYSESDITVTADLNRALTSNTGTVVYDIPKRQDTYELNDNESFYKMAKINQKEIHLAAKESKNVIVSLSIPKEAFSGLVVGAVYFKEEIDEDKAVGQQVINQFAYSIPIELIESEELPKKDISLENVYPSLRDYYPFIEAEIRNHTPNFISQLDVDARIIDLRSNKAVYVSKQSNLKMAPMSDFTFGFDLKGSPITAGKYKLQMKIDADGEEKNFEKIFRVEIEEADKLNEESIIVPTKKTTHLWFILLAVLVLLAAVIFFVYVQMKKKKMTTKKIHMKNKNKK